jgi:hypothetical protein
MQRNAGGLANPGPLNSAHRGNPTTGRDGVTTDSSGRDQPALEAQSGQRQVGARRVAIILAHGCNESAQWATDSHIPLSRLALLQSSAGEKTITKARKDENTKRTRKKPIKRVVLSRCSAVLFVFSSFRAFVIVFH